MYIKVLEVQAEYQDHIIFCAGDMNVCFSSNDSLNRIGSQNENLLSDVIRNNNKVAELSAEDGYTWKRGIMPVRGPGIVKVNTKILDDPIVVLQIGTAIEEMMSQTDDSWNPHERLEFLKVAFCSVFYLNFQR